METLFLKFLNLSINASILIAAILFFRFAFWKAPKWITCLIWSLVGIRLLIPFSIESSFSLIPQREPIPSSTIVRMTPASSVISQAITTSIDTSVNVTQSSSTSVILFLSYVWIAGLIIMFAYTFFSYLVLRNKLKTATLYSAGVKQSENVSSPFVLGIIRPTIFIPYSLNDSDLKYVLFHERAHVKRRDYIWKPLGFLILSVYWFNPIIWLAYIILCKDIELACDERVINRLDSDARKEYSRVLLNCSVKHKMIIACPVAFGETDVKRRVKKVMNYKKPAFWIILVAILCCIVVGICFMTYPQRHSIADNEKDNMVKETNKTESAQTGENDTSDSQTVSLRKMTVDDINQLKSKRDFSWDDFSIFEGEDIGSGLFVFKYEMDDGGYVLVSGSSLDQKPQTIIYYRSDGEVDYLLSNPQENHFEKYRISADQLSQMTDDELVENVMNHPYLTEVYVVNDPQIVIDKMPEISDAFAELLKRGSATESIMTKVRSLYEEVYVTKSADADSAINYDKLCLLLYYSKDCRNALQPEDLQIVENSSMVNPND